MAVKRKKRQSVYALAFDFTPRPGGILAAERLTFAPNQTRRTQDACTQERKARRFRNWSRLDGNGTTAQHGTVRVATRRVIVANCGESGRAIRADDVRRIAEESQNRGTYVCQV